MKRTVHYVIPDTQIMPSQNGIPKFIHRVAQHIRAVKPTHVIHLGDHYDMASLCSYDEGKRSMENQRVEADIAAGDAALLPLTNAANKVGAKKIFLLGNHEHRLDRASEDDAVMTGLLSTKLLGAHKQGWDVVPFLLPYVQDGVAYCHYFPRSSYAGREVQSRHGSNNARLQAQREMRSCTSGHVQGFDYYEHYTSQGPVQSLIAGSCYSDHMKYFSPQGHDHFRGIIVKRFYASGRYDLELVSLARLALEF